MNRTLRIFSFAAIIAGASAAHAVAAESLVTPVPADSVVAATVLVEWSATYASWYSFQGIDYSNGLPVVQPQITAGFHGLSLGLWGNVDQTRGEWNEVDATLQAEREMGPITAALGYGYLHYPNRDWEATHELVADLAWAGPVQTELGVHWDVAAGRGGYWTLGLSRETPFRSATATLGAKLYVQQHYYGQSGIPALETSIGVSAPWAGLVFQPSLSRLWAWSNGDFRDDQAIGSRWVMSLTCSTP